MQTHISKDQRHCSSAVVESDSSMIASGIHGRRAVAEERVAIARRTLSHCELCSHRCGVDRLQGPNGACHAGATPRIFSAQIETGDELELLPTYAIALSGCSIRCSFCITGLESWNSAAGKLVDIQAHASRVSRALLSGAAKTVQILGGEPTIHLPWLLEFISYLPDEARVVLKTNGLCDAQSRELLAGLVDVWLVDLKFGNDTCAMTLARSPHYSSSVRETLEWAAAESELIIRHLLLPGHVECCWRPAALWIAEHIPDAKVSLRFGYWPSWKALHDRSLNRVITAEEQREALAIARSQGLNLIP